MSLLKFSMLVVCYVGTCTTALHVCVYILCYTGVYIYYSVYVCQDVCTCTRPAVSCKKLR